jgi:Uma2 family endonuclease
MGAATWPDVIWPKLNLRPVLNLDEQQFMKLCSANPDLRLELSAQGDLLIMAPAGTDSGGRNMELSMQLAVWAKRTGLGRVFDSSTGYKLPNGAIRSPDASWIARDRWDALSPEQKKTFAPICPDFVVELRSPTDTRKSAQEKMQEYIGQGARLGWLIDPIAGEVEVYRPGRLVELLKGPTTLSGEDVLPGFVLDLKGILFD